VKRLNRFFSKKEKSRIYLKSIGRCGICRRELGGNWHADHIIPVKYGGPTLVSNGQALCPPCNIKKGDRLMIEYEDLREWQKQATDAFETTLEREFLAVVSPAGGKTIWAVFQAHRFLRKNPSGFLIIVVPTTALKSQWRETAKRCFNIDLAIGLSIKDRKPYLDPRVKGICTTYSGLSTLLPTIEMWKKDGRKMFGIFDEIHHTSSEENQKWGNATMETGRLTERNIVLSGTPKRTGSERIALVRYRPDGEYDANFTYTYGQAITDQVCRMAIFKRIGGDVKWRRDGEEITVAMKDADNKNRADICKTIFHSNSQWMAKSLITANGHLDEMRETDPDAACLVVVQGGRDEKTDDLYAQMTANLIRNKLGIEDPIVVHSSDEHADQKIDEFRTGTSKFIIAVKKVSEGVDIKRIRVIIYATTIRTDVFFVQIVGRATRWENNHKGQFALILIPDLPDIVEISLRIESDLKAALRSDRERRERLARENDEILAEESEFPGIPKLPDDSTFEPLWAEFKEQGYVAKGMLIGDEKYAEAERMIEEHPSLYAGFPPVLLMSLNAAYEDARAKKPPTPDLEFNDERFDQLPREEQKKEYRSRINKTILRCADLKAQIEGREKAEPKDFAFQHKYFARRHGYKNLESLDVESPTLKQLGDVMLDVKCHVDQLLVTLERKEKETDEIQPAKRKEKSSISKAFRKIKDDLGA
jgi:superfamily II DNA or RNA helicase